MLAWLSVWSEVQTCIWPSRCHCHSLSLASAKPRLVLPFSYRFTRVVPDKGPLNGCMFVVCSCKVDHVVIQDLQIHFLELVHKIEKMQNAISVLTETIIRHPLSTSCIYYDPQHPPCSIYMLHSPFRQPLSRSSLVFLLVLDPLLHTLCISSPNHHLIFATHAHTITACFVVVPVLCHLFLISLSAPCLEICLFSLTPHIHLTILISAR